MYYEKMEDRTVLKRREKKKVAEENLPQDPKSKLKRLFKGWILPFGIEIIVILLLIKFVFFFSFVPTGSMIPTIAEKSWLFALHTHNIEETAKRGDILVFRNDETGQTLIKRLIGLPGEFIEIRDGVVYVDGEMLEEDYVVFPSYENRTFQVPEGEFLFFGDNRKGSYDARMWNDPYIPAKNVKGRAVFTLFPLRNFGVLR